MLTYKEKNECPSFVSDIKELEKSPFLLAMYYIGILLLLFIILLILVLLRYKTVLKDRFVGKITRYAIQQE